MGWETVLDRDDNGNIWIGDIECLKRIEVITECPVRKEILKTWGAIRPTGWIGQEGREGVSASQALTTMKPDQIIAPPRYTQQD